MSYVPPKKNTQFIFYIGLVSQSDTRTLQSNPTIAAGDFKISTDGAALANLGTLPVVTPAGSRMVKITLSTSEMNGDNVTVVCSDAAGGEWCDRIINIQTVSRQIDDLASQTSVDTIDDYVDELELRIPANLTAPTAAPSAAPTFATGLSWVFTVMRNKLTADGTQQTLYADDGSTPIATSATADDGSTFTRSEWA